MTAVVLQNKDGLFLNATSNILDQMARIPVGTAIQIEYTGDEKTSNGYNVKKFDIRVLKVKTTPVVVGDAHTEKPDQAFPREKKPAYTNQQRSTEYYSKVYSPDFKFNEEEARAHLETFDNDFGKAIDALGESEAQF
jgi:hypothetical protein